MRWFINSTKESAGFNDNNDLQKQIDAINTRIDLIGKDLSKQLNRVSDTNLCHDIETNKILENQGKQNERIDALEEFMKGIQRQIDKLEKSLEIWSHRVETLEEDSCENEDKIQSMLIDIKNSKQDILEISGITSSIQKEWENGRSWYGMKDITDTLQKRIEELKSANDTKANKRILNQAIKKQPKFRRLRNTFGDPKFTNAYAIANGYAKAGFKQDAIAIKLNSLGFKTPNGLEFSARHVSDLLCNPVQKSMFMQGSEKKAIN